MVTLLDPLLDLLRPAFTALDICQVEPDIIALAFQIFGKFLACLADVRWISLEFGGQG